MKHTVSRIAYTSLFTRVRLDFHVVTKTCTSNIQSRTQVAFRMCVSTKRPVDETHTIAHKSLFTFLLISLLKSYSSYQGETQCFAFFFRNTVLCLLFSYTTAYKSLFISHIIIILGAKHSVSPCLSPCRRDIYRICVYIDYRLLFLYTWFYSTFS